MLALPIPQTISLTITTECGSRCPHCYLVETDEIGRHRLSVADVENVVEDAAKNGVHMMVVSGGDPLRHPDLDPILRTIRRHRILPLLGISGDYLLSAHIALLTELGIPCVQVSLDSATASLHDSRRGIGSFRNVMANVERLQNAGILVNIAACLSMENRSELVPLLDLAKQLDIHKVKIAFYEQVGPIQGATVIPESTRAKLLSLTKHFADANDWSDRVVVLGYDFHSGERLPTRAMGRPPIVVTADGTLRSGEDGPGFGHLREANTLSYQYRAWLSERISNYFDAVISLHSSHLGIRSILDVNEGLPCNGIVFAEGGLHTVLIRDGLDWPLDQFTVLHELGHIATGTLRANVQREYRADDERMANLWALECIRPVIRPDEFPYYVRDAKTSEHALYTRITQRLAGDVIPPTISE
ncbi:Antilisterial bacteriocin subtilosin biosynthesis protein AlbA [Pandoraea pneumonica]|uniref:Antilisterial bacteriocin subtilosin biosynthesis protein AlbA n=1 Tax=Pandoraea pneumonica TaxID=2508299 RepID=A0A5E4UPH9_9BURK|nr:radical SAM protein [Pandoraea pneumonica]VVE00270.1 Antilisterial bacteriocin subtilosin biosynthesis protein AlbA [Pandoraea pneumonica]